MKVGLVLRMIIVLFFLGQYHTVAARPHISGRNRLLLCIGFPMCIKLSSTLVSLQVWRGYRIFSSKWE
jgi:hypothetical protein